MIDYINNYIVIWLPEGNGARLLKIYGQTANVVVPDNINGINITSIGDYCFAQKEHLKGITEEETLVAQADSTKRVLYGKYIESVVLPNTVRQLGNCAFYGCSSLESLECGRMLLETGSDAFLNCQRLKLIRVRGSITEKTGIRTMLSQISSDVRLCFTEGDIITAALFFPEYYESYDEIGPAHIFGLNIEGEGFRARQCFKDGIVELQQYDSIFEKASVEESEKTLSRMALDRLQYPVFLNSKYEEQYRQHILVNGENVLRRLIDIKELKGISFLCKTKAVSSQAVENSITYAADLGWAEGTASLMKWKREFYKAKSTSYDFDSF